MIVFEWVKYLMIVAGVWVGVVWMIDFIGKRRRKFGKEWSWEYLILSICGFYWAVYYMRSSLGIVIGSTHQIWVRSPLLVTLLCIAIVGTTSVIRHWKRRIK